MKSYILLAVFAALSKPMQLTDNFRYNFKKRRLEIYRSLPGVQSWRPFEAERAKKNWSMATTKDAIERKEELQREYGQLQEKNIQIGTDFRIFLKNQRVQLRLVNLAGIKTWVDFNPQKKSLWYSKNANPTIDSRHKSLVAQWDKIIVQFKVDPVTGIVEDYKGSTKAAVHPVLASAAKIQVVGMAPAAQQCTPLSVIENSLLALEDTFTPTYSSNALSDHGTVLDQNIGSWNISMQGSQFSPTSFNHKFAKLVNESDEQYERRLTRVADKIVRILNHGKVSSLFLQEAPHAKTKHHKFFINLLRARNLDVVENFDFTLPVVTKRGERTFRLEPSLRTNVLAKNPGGGHTLLKMINRIVPYNNGSEVVVNVHGLWDQVSMTCKVIGDYLEEIKRDFPGKRVRFIGDFNNFGTDIVGSQDQSCKSLNITKLKTTRNSSVTKAPKAFSAQDNYGSPNIENIDLVLEF